MDEILLVFNIPEGFSASNLRSHFSAFVETGKFLCFHYKRRPESLLPNFDKTSALQVDTVSSGFCCPIKIEKQYSAQLFERYNGKHWTDAEGKDLDLKCFITKGTESFHWTNMKESITPSVYPQGNVGTPTSFFMEAIRHSRLPPTVIKKLQICSNLRRPLFAPKMRVIENPDGFTPTSSLYNYPTKVQMKRDKIKESISKTETIKSDVSNLTEPSETKKANKKAKKVRIDEDSEERVSDNEEQVSSGEEEEWDRHRELHNDVSARRVLSHADDIEYQQGTQERKYEEPMEVTWEKGGSGLVFYTDEQYWREQGQDDSDEADDWDVDMEGYDVEGGGDLDNRSFMSMDKFNKLESGRLHMSAFKPKKSSKSEQSTGYFEKHTKGVGRRLLEKQGWRDGKGLGSNLSGISRPLSSRGCNDRAGLGFKGNPQIYPKASNTVPQMKKIEPLIKISTAYDDPG